MIRVGFELRSTGDGWLGGVSYLRNLLTALVETPRCQIEPVLLTSRTSAAVPDSIPHVRTVRAGRLESSIGSAARKIGRATVGRDVFAECMLTARGISALSHSGDLGRGSRLPVINWIPDFQHKRCPEFFSASEVRQRDASFARICEYSDRILVSSQDAMGDLERHFPAAAGRARVLRFAACSTPAVMPDFTGVLSHYGVSAPYFLLPNQFWVHKNHRLVIEALAIARSRGRELTVVATGNTRDYRAPGHFECIVKRVVAAGLQQSFRILGIVPYRDLQGLLHGAAAVLNPSLFEGWSTSVEEAKALGKLTLLSDIAVHREQAPDRAVYFDPHSPEQLAESMIHANDAYSASTEHEARQAAAARFVERRAEFAHRYARVIKELVR